MKSGITIFLVAVLAYILQTTFFSSFFLALAEASRLKFLEGQTVNVSLIALIYLALHRDLSGALIWSIVFGAIGTSFGLGWHGALASSYFVVGVLCSTLRKQLAFEETISIAGFVGVLTLFQGLIHLHMGRWLSGVPHPLMSHFGFLLLQVLINAIFAPPIFGSLKMLDRWMGVARVKRESLIMEL